MNQHVVTLYPHPDDETFGKAGTLALFAKQGIPVTVVCGTLGQMGRNMGKPFFATREALPAIREKELRDACDIMGVQELRLLGLRDKTVEFEDRAALAQTIFNILSEIRPHIVMTYYPGYGFHPDHDAMAWATVRAVAMFPENERPLVYCSPVTDRAEEILGPPDIVLDVREVMDTKLAAIEAHRSQSAVMISRWERMKAEQPEEYEKFVQQFMNTERYWLYPFQD